MRRLRITGGVIKGRYIEVHDNIHIRHTSSKVRGSIFNMLGDVHGKRIIDLFSGSGILAFEAISREAHHATIVEINKKAAEKIKKNIDALNLNEKFLILNMDVIDAIQFLSKEKKTYDVVFMDPPYEKGYIGKTLKVLEENVIFNSDTVFVIESSKREMVKNHLSKNWYIIKEKIYGDTAVAIIKSEIFSKN
ncbi:MAG: 16S rRNA (guanine(966)-N(2))-methyltransferase RsmD [Syntrophorhabdaceae bacterium]|nr:16S rRNA (guanine(966)-N(2))-methyltransferase RsmD [Syntrophorhabdaceae bacterium]